MGATDEIIHPLSGADVNPGVDTPWELKENRDLSGLVINSFFRIQILAREGRLSPTEEALNSIRQNHSEFVGLLQAIKMALGTPRYLHHLYTEKGKGDAAGMYEFKRIGKQARLFFFYGADYDLAEDLLISVSGYFKSKPSREQQNRAFRSAARIRDEFLSSKGQDDD